MAEYIFELNEALYDEETGEAVFKPIVKARIVRCKDCLHWKTVIVKSQAEFGFCDREDLLTTRGREFFCAAGKRDQNEKS